ncbi:aspartate/glutamate racemase family protein [Haliovirga abyssi]|uniref:Aspartate racemase n=1 Tax=Haliovirga abyssi TaxID=2996794 RepID=A0AAU9D0L1_9FUSO|nr:aspartate/glutamate racemase family protein [Haliovirga abyssi]BDU49496.1 aspartate racemase [Haliovirga abyssi]
MKTIGLIGGMSWESSAEYYRIINEIVKNQLGDLHSCKSIMYSVDFAEIEKLQHDGKWNELTSIMIKAAQSLESAGADNLIICTNTMHKMANEVQESVRVPLIHIADATGECINKKGYKKVGLLGTKFTMGEEFYRGRLEEKFGIEVLVPSEEDQKVVHKIIYDELVKGVINEQSRKEYKNIIDKFRSQGAEGVILGCTEIPLLIKQEDSSIEIFDTTMIHAKAAVESVLR